MTCCCGHQNACGGSYEAPHAASYDTKVVRAETPAKKRVGIPNQKLGDHPMDTTFSDSELPQEDPGESEDG